MDTPETPVEVKRQLMTPKAFQFSPTPTPIKGARRLLKEASVQIAKREYGRRAWCSRERRKMEKKGSGEMEGARLEHGRRGHKR